MEETAYHSGEEVQEVVNDEVTEQLEVTDQQPEGESSPPQEEPRGIKVKYNKEERFVPEDEVPNWVQKGLNYDKVSEKAQQAERYQQSLDRIAKFYGYPDHDSYMAALEQAEMDKRIQEEAEKLGVDEDVIRNHLQPLNQKLTEYETKLRTIEEQEAIRKVESQITIMENDPTNFPDFGKHKQAVLQAAYERGYSLEDAYKIVTYDSRVQAAALQAQQEAVRKLQQNADSSTGSLGADSPDHATGYLSMSKEERRAFKERVKAGKI